MLTPGPKTTATPWALHSRPMAAPTLRASAGLHAQASADAVGKHVAFTLWPPFSRMCRRSSLRRPCGPSASHMEGTPLAGMSCVSQKLFPLARDAFSSSVSEAMMFPIRSFVMDFPPARHAP